MAVKNIQPVSFTRIELKIAKHVFRHYKDKYNARQLAKILSINHAHANKLCGLLIDKELLIKEQLGNSAYFSFNYGNVYAMKLIAYLLSLEEKEFPKGLIILAHKLKSFSQHIKLGFVFGSAIKNKDFHDIDILLVYEPEDAAKIRAIKEEIRRSQMVTQPIRYVDMTEKDVLSNKEDAVLYSALSNNLVFAGPERYSEVIRKCRR